METNFYVGQEVVAICDHPKGYFKKGDEFLIRDIKKNCCRVILDIGIYEGKHLSICICGNATLETGYIWFASTRFSPKQQLSETTYNDIQEWIKQGKELAILN